MSDQFISFVRSQIPDYPDPKKEYKFLTVVKAQQRLDSGEGWTKEKDLVRHLSSGNDEYLVALSRARQAAPAPTTPTQKGPGVVAKVKEAIRGSRKS